ncbi:hypothetical protein [Ferruginibacter profundus]
MIHNSNLKKTTINNNRLPDFYLTMQTALKHIETYYRNKTATCLAAFDYGETNISIHCNKNILKEIDTALIKENAAVIAWIEHDSNANNFAIITCNTVTGAAASFALYGAPDFDGYYFYTFVWIKDALFCIYEGDHNYFYIHTIENNNAKYIAVKGDAVRVFENFITFQHYGINEPVYKVDIPGLLTSIPLTEAEATALDIMPAGLGLMYYAGHNFYRLANVPHKK